MALTYTGVLACKCPYCGYVNIVRSGDFENNRLETIMCDCDDHTGCGKVFAIRPVLVAQVETYLITEVK